MQGHPYDAKVDLWSVGVIVYGMLKMYMYVYIYIRVFITYVYPYLQSTCTIHAYVNACRITKPSMNSICAQWIKKKLSNTSAYRSRWIPYVYRDSTDTPIYI